MTLKNQISVVGAGPVGSLLSIYLAKKGYNVEVFEKRMDPRASVKSEGRSINIALSHRGLRPLKEIGLENDIKEIAVPMKGRMIHNEIGTLTFQPYGEEGQMIYSVSRNELNKLLIEKAEQDHHIKFNFQSHCDDVDIEKSLLTISSDKNKYTVESEAVFGTDGAFSAVRKSYSKFSNFTFDQENLSHGYIELHLPEGNNGKHQMETNALHIWPREQFMLIALPNNDGSFTCTLFLPRTGNNSFEKIKTSNDVEFFFKKYFSDVIPLMPDYIDNYFTLPPSSLVTMYCYPWTYHNTLLAGDAAHAITPFYGQGMNAGFEDCRILNEIMSEIKGSDWKKIFQKFQMLRKENADAIAALALQNFIEMRDLVGDREFLLRKKIEAVMHKRIPTYLPLYTMVTFSDLPYKEAYEKGREHDQLMMEVMKIPDIENKYSTESGWREIENVFFKRSKI